MAESQLNLKLGDIIEIESPTNSELHEQTHYILYIDETKIIVQNVANLNKTALNIREDGSLSDESIVSISLLDRSEDEGYARQHGLLPHTWIDIHIGGDVPAVITGEITNLEEDMIEVTTYPDRRVIYFDFEYKGLPVEIPIEKFIIRQKPVLPKKTVLVDDLSKDLEEGSVAASMETSESGDLSIIIPEDAVADDEMRDVLRNLYVDANEIVFGEELDEVTQVVEVPEGERRYGIEMQVNDMMDELLSNIPNNQRTKTVMDNIHNLIERFKQLRRDFSTFDDNLNVVGFSNDGTERKPIIEKIKNLKENLRWIMPVVAQKRRICVDRVDEYDDVTKVKMGAELVAHNELYKQYMNGSLKYTALYASQSKPFEPKADDSGLTDRQEVMADIDAIVDNLGEFFSTVSNAERCRFVIQRYNLGLTKKDTQLLKSGKTVFVRGQMTPNDNMTVNSFLLLPKAVTQFSKIAQPGTNIATRVSIHQNYLTLFRLLNKKTVVNTHIVDDLSKEVEHDFSNIKEFQMDEALENEPDKMSKFLNTIIPTTSTLVKQMGKYIRNKMSFVDVVRELEPFGVYSDDISIKQYNEIKLVVSDQIKEYHKTYDDMSQKFQLIRDMKLNVSSRLNQILFILNNTDDYKERPAFIGMFNDGYKCDYTKDPSMYRASEILTDVIEKDGARLLSDIIITLSLKTLTNPTDLLAMFEPADIDDITDIEKIKPKDCVRRYLAKRYVSMKELQLDNGKDEIFYDKEFDDTPYHIVGLYSKEKKAMEPKSFMEFLIDALINKHSVEPGYASELARILIAGKKTISEGEYAVLDPDGYFHRVKDHWLRDSSMSADLLIDTNTLFCNIRSDCIKNESNMVCESDKTAIARINDLNKARLVKEFEKRVETSIEQLDQKIKMILTEDFKRVSRDMMLKTVKAHRHNNYAYALGNTAIMEETVISPNTHLLDAILAQDDFIKKQSDTLKFSEMFCREPMEDLGENQFWLYCKETNTKLLPVCLSELARAFVLDIDYGSKLDEICAKQGVMSDDGDSIVDKYSGRILRKIDFVSEEVFNEDGFRMVSNAVMEKDLGVKINEMFVTKQKPVFENKKNETIYNILDAICGNIGIETSAVQDFVMRTTLELLEKSTNATAKTKYEEKSQLIFKKKGMYPIAFEVHSDRLMFWYLASMLLISIQTAIPSFRIKKTFPGCYRSFSGYPLDGGVEDKTGISYIACVLHKMKSSTAPWNSIEKLALDAYISRITDTLKEIDRPDILDLYNKKRAVLDVELIPEEHSVSKWLSFLPPVVKFEIGNIQTVTKDFERDLLELMRSGHKDQREQLAIMSSKCVKYGYGIIELINKIVKHKDQLLKTASKEPYLENACCNDSPILKPIDYFGDIDVTIKQYNSISKALGEFGLEAKKYAKASTLFHDEFTGITRAVISDNITEHDIYAVYIYYCNFSNDRPIPEEYISVCPNKPEGFPVGVTLMEQVEWLKKHGKRYTSADFNHLMTLVRIKNKVVLSKSVAFSQVDVMFDILDRFDSSDSQVIEEKMRHHLREVMSSYDPNIMVVEQRPALVNYKNYLSTSNGTMLNRILEFMNDYGNLSNQRYSELVKVLSSSAGSIDFVRNSIYFMTKAFPAMIVNGASFRHLPSSWDFAKPHYSDLHKMLDRTWFGIKEYSGDKIMAELLKDVESRTADIYTLVKELPLYKPLVKGEFTYYSLFDNDSINMTYMYLWYSAIYEYIVCSSNVQLLTTEVESNKSARRKEARKEESDLVAGLDEDLGEDDDDMREVDIQLGSEAELKERTAKLLMSYFTMETENKNLSISYDEISKRIRKEKNIEKHKIVKYLGEMSKDERAIEDQFKKYKMGRWNVGLQKGMFRYDKDTFTRERAEMMGDDEDEEEEGANEEEEINDNQEEFGIQQFGEDYTDGDYYGDHREDENEFGDV